jgi:serine/threonine protein kinase
MGAACCTRDVKPANIVVNPEPPIGRATLIDFGLARHEALAAAPEEAAGTVRYMAQLDCPREKQCDEHRNHKSAGSPT